MSHIRSCLARIVVENPTTRAELMELARDAWRTHGPVVIWLDTVNDAIVRQALINEANRQYGCRPKRRC